MTVLVHYSRYIVSVTYMYVSYALNL